VYVCVYICVLLCVCVCVYVYIYIYIYVYIGTGPVDAAFQAVNRLCGLYGAAHGNAQSVKLLDYTVSSVTAGIDALGEVTVRLQDPKSGRIFQVYIFVYMYCVYIRIHIHVYLHVYLLVYAHKNYAHTCVCLYV
jgi:hypothetical protein